MTPKVVHPDASTGVVLVVSLGDKGWEVVATSARGASRSAPRHWAPAGSADDATWLRGLMSTVDGARAEALRLGMRPSSVLLVPATGNGPAAGRRVLGRRGLDRSLSRAIGLPVSLSDAQPTRRLTREAGVLVITLGAKPSLRQESEGDSAVVPWALGRDAQTLTAAEILRTYKKKGGRKARDLAGVVSRARAGERAAVAAFESFGRSLGRALARGRKAPGAGRVRLEGVLGSALDLYGPAAQEAYQSETGHSVVWVAPVELARRGAKR